MHLIETPVASLVSMILVFIKNRLHSKMMHMLIKHILKIYHLYVVSTLIWRFNVKL